MDVILLKVRAVLPEELHAHALKRRPEFDEYPLWLMTVPNHELREWADISAGIRRTDA
jgi:hypothetical protein